MPRRGLALAAAALPRPQPAAGPSTASVYPLYMIGSSNKHHCLDKTCTKFNMTAADADAIAGFRYVEGSFDADEIAMVRARGTGTAFTSYVESANTYNDMRSHTGFEFGFRADARFYLHGNLSGGVGRTQSVVGVCQYVKLPYGRDGHPAPLVASTPGVGDYSNGSYGIVTYIRVRDEVMKIVGAENASDAGGGTQCQRLTVVRGFEGTDAGAYARGVEVLAPAFDFGPPFGVAPGEYKKGPPTYHPRYNSTYGVEWLANWTVSAVANGYQGAWLDSFHPQPTMRQADPAGGNVLEWDMEGGGIMTAETCVAQQRARLQRVWELVHRRLGRYPVIIANDGGQWEPTFLTESPGFRPLDGLCLEAWGGGEGDSVKPGCWNGDPVPSHWHVNWHDEAGWLREVGRVQDAAQAGLRAFPAIGQAGCVASSVEALAPALRDQFELYTYASYLMGVESRDPSHAPHLGIAGYYVDPAMTVRAARIHERYTWPIGAPARSAPGANATAYHVAGHASYLRPFTNGVVLVNPGAAADPGVPLGGVFADPVTGRAASAASLPAHSGAILLTKAV